MSPFPGPGPGVCFPESLLAGRVYSEALRVVLLLLLFQLIACAEPEALPVSYDAESHLWLAPASAAVGSARTLMVRGVGTDWRLETPEVEFGEGVDVAVTEVLAFDLLRIQVLVGEGAALGPRDLRVRWGQREIIRRAAFAVESGAISVSPVRASLGEALRVEVSGWKTEFLVDHSQLSFGAGIDLRDVVVLSPTRIAATLLVNPRADPGPRDVAVIQGPGDVWTLAHGFTVDRDDLSMEIVPAEGDQGQRVKVAITAERGGFVQGQTTVDLGTGVVIEETVVRSATRVDATLRLGNNASPGPRDVWVITQAQGSPTALRVLPDGFTIHPVEADPLDVRISLGFGVSRSWDEDDCDFSLSVYASALFFEANDFPCPQSGGSSSLVAPPRWDEVSSGRSRQGGATDCPAPKTFDAGPQVHFVAGERVVDLWRDVNPYTGRVSYRALGLGLSDYATGTTFTLLTDGGDLGWSELPAWTIPEAIRTLPRDFEIDAPDFCDLIQPRDEPLSIEWDAAATYDEAQLYITLSGFPDAELGIPVLMTYPWDDGEWTFTPEMLSFFPAGYAVLVESAYRTTRFEVPGATVPNAGFGNSTIFHRAEFAFE